MASDNFKKWLKTASTEELQERQAQGPTNEEDRLIHFELDHRQETRQQKISQRSMYATIAAALAALLSLVVTFVQVNYTSDSSSASKETLRRDVMLAWHGCMSHSWDLELTDSLQPPAPDSPEELRQAWQDIRDQKLDMRKHRETASAAWAAELDRLGQPISRSLTELQTAITTSTICMKMSEQQLRVLETRREIYLDLLERSESLPPDSE